ncbi:MAG: sorbosone dehydrogenase, partial [Gemmatimonadetes bacterium]|nr:sorbosone dehydrogenase [Gemmatimonadota bacterium]
MALRMDQLLETMSTRRLHLALGAIMSLGVGCHPTRATPSPEVTSQAQVASVTTAVAVATGAPASAPAPPRRDPFEGADLSPKPPVVPRSPTDEQSRFILPAGYRMVPVLTEPAIQQPAAISFDGDGRMFVLELRTYMLDADARDQLAPVSRISRWEDRNNDGVYETHTVFADSLVFPRFATPYGANAILTMESNSSDVWKLIDTNGDGRADRKELFTTNFGRLANVEHLQSSLFWALDNWLYSTVNAFRVRATPAGVVREPTGFNDAQWGASQDDDGKIWFQGGWNGVPSYFQFPIAYGNFAVPDQYSKDFDEIWGAPVRLADMQGGMAAVRMPDGSLSRATAGSGSNVYRGGRLPAELMGDYFYGEVVGRVVRRVRPVKLEGLTQVVNVYQPEKAEFIRSTDPLFRPVEIKSAPDGSMYVVDMYHGVIQESQWTPKGSYLRAKLEQYKLDKIVGLGRIWRLTHDATPRDTTRPRMLAERPARLVRHLENPNGWWRDMAQQLLVLRQDRSVVPALRTMARRDTIMVARIHALWTLEGLGALDSALVREQMKDHSPRMRVQA